MTTTAGRCPPEHVTWTGTNKCHCTGCCQTFSTVKNFDLHRSGSKDKKFKQGECSDPAKRGMSKNKHGVWIAEGDVDYDKLFGR